MESRFINGGTTTKYFSLGRGARQGHSILAFLFVLTLELLFFLIKSKQKIERMRIFDYNYFYSAYADDTTIGQFHFCQYVVKYLRDSSLTQFLSSLRKTNSFLLINLVFNQTSLVKIKKLGLESLKFRRWRRRLLCMFYKNKKQLRYLNICIT